MSNENHQDILKRSKKWLETGAKGISVRWPADNGGSLKTFSAELRRLADSYKEHEHDFIFTMVETEVQEERRAALEGGSLLVTAPSLCNAQSGRDLREALESVLANNQGEAKYAWKSCAQGDKAYLLPFLLPGTPLILPSHKHVIHGYSYKSIMQFKKWPSLYWGRYEEVLITENVFSCIRWANGKFHDKFLFIVNVGNVESTNDYSIKLSRFTIPKKGRVVVSTSPKFKQGDIIDVTGLTLAPGDSMLLQIPMFSL